MDDSDDVWADDVLGTSFTARTLRLPGAAEATLVRYTPPDRPAAEPTAEPTAGRPPVLYVHGFADYYFQRHLAEAVAAKGYPFYAVDLRGHGRSVDAWTAAGHDANMVDRLELYGEDLDAATDAIAADGHTGLVLMGHSTGGLLASIYADDRPERVTALVLNSPWFDLRGTWIERGPVTRAMYVLGRVAPRLVVSSLSEGYGRALHQEGGGEWDYDLRWKPYKGFPVRAGWLAAIRRGHRRIARGLSLRCPVLLCTSGRTGRGSADPATLLSTDSVLDVAHMHTGATRLGTTVDVAVIEGGAHDLALSPAPARETYLTAVLDWLDATV